MMRVLLAFVALLAQPSWGRPMVCQADHGSAPQPAFPGAEGAGAYATGGRGGTVYQVTNLDASGPGSLADAVSAPNRIIVFAVSGTIDLSSGKQGKAGKISIDSPNITIAGQTAPGEGICIRNGYIRVTAGNVIIRYLRVRRGFITKGNMGDSVDIKGDFQNVIVDHISASWATDENLTLTNANNVTAQYCIAAEGLDYYNPNQTPPRHSEGSLFGTKTPNGRMTIHHTLYAHNRLRNPRTTSFDGDGAPPALDVRNNVIYDCKELTSHTGSQPVRLNLINNYYKDGPSTGIEGADIKQVIFTFMNSGPNKMYANGNYVHGSPRRTENNWLAVNYRKGVRTESELRVDKPFETPYVTTESALEAYEAVLAGAGCTLPSRDAVDLRVVNDVRNGAGAVINYETDIPKGGRWQTYYSLPGPADTDGDGIPDYWEEQLGLAKNSATTIGFGGYANIEHYFNNTDPKGGPTPIVYVSATISRAYRQDASPGELRFTRTGSTDLPLVVQYTASGKGYGSVTIPAGSKLAKLSIKPQGDKLVVVTVGPQPAYHIGCPRSALVAIEDGATPPPVDIRNVDLNGGGSAADRKQFAETLKEHKAWKKVKRAKE